MSVSVKQAAGAGVAALVGAIVGAGAVIGLGHGRPDPAATGAIVRGYVLDHPELISEAMDRLQDRQTAQAISDHRAAIETPFAGAIAGNPKGDVTLVEYFDYACGYCRQSVADVDRLVAGDPKLRVVFKELPILAPESARAAQLSLVAAKAGKFLAYHHALYGEGPLSDAKIDAAAKQAGIDGAGADGADIVGEINANLTVARGLHLSGTPTFVVGSQLFSGAVGYQALKDAVDKARTAHGA